MSSLGQGVEPDDSGLASEQEVFLFSLNFNFFRDSHLFKSFENVVCERLKYGGKAK